MYDEQDNQLQEVFLSEEILLVDPGQAPLRIDRFLLDRLEKTSRNRIQNALKIGLITVNEQRVKPNYKVRPLDQIKIIIPRHPEAGTDVQPEEMDLDIVYEDDSILIVNKEAGMVVHPGVGNYSGTLVNGLKHHLQNQDLPIKEGNLQDRPGLVHRIDKETTGLLVIAKTESAMTHLAKQFYDHTVERKYMAIVWGNFEASEGTIEGHLGRNPKNRLLMHVFPEGDQGKHAITHYRVLEDLYYVSLIECQLETGRTHQIRAHMNFLGHPIFNDERYGGSRIVKGTVFSKYRQFVHNCFDLCKRQALHAKTLGFVHPETNEPMRFDSPLPGDMNGVLNKWRVYVNARKKTEYSDDDD